MQQLKLPNGEKVSIGMDMQLRVTRTDVIFSEYIKNYRKEVVVHTAARKPVQTMFRFLVLTSFLILHVDFASVLRNDNEPKLVLVHLVHRHGDRTPGAETYPNDPYINETYYPVGRGGLTNTGKLRTHRLGQLVKCWYGDFLGPIYTPEVIESRSSFVDRVIMSLQLVQSGLFPPAPIQRWNCKLPWQPIPYVYWPITEDFILNPQFCSSAYIAENNRVRNTTKVRQIIAQFDRLLTSIRKHTGLAINGLYDVFLLHFTIEAQISENMPQPKWLPEVYEGIRNLTILEMKMTSYTDLLTRKFGGTLLRKITDDVTKYANGTLLKGRKFFHYSAHTSNIASLQIALGVFKPHIPAYTSAQMVEIWKRDSNLYVKLVYYTGIPGKLITQQIPECDVLCPFETFLKLLKPHIATDEDMACDL